MLFEHDAEAVDARLDAMAATVCENDPRTHEQRRADALGALGHGADRLVCLCGSETFPAAGIQPNDVVINAIAEEKALTEDTAVVLDGPEPERPTEPVPETSAPARAPAAAVISGTMLLAPLLAAKIAAGATIRWITHPGDAPPEPGIGRRRRRRGLSAAAR